MRGEGNHKIPGSFAPENMEKTGAERVKYSLACQHEDAIPIKFVSYAQKCPTVLCTFAVALRKESVDRNIPRGQLPATQPVALRKESVDRNRGSVAGKSGTLSRSPQGEHKMFLFLTVQGGFVHADIRFNFKNCYSKKLSHKII